MLGVVGVGFCQSGGAWAVVGVGVGAGARGQLAAAGWVGGEYGLRVGMVVVVHLFLFVVLMGSATSTTRLSAACGLDQAFVPGGACVVEVKTFFWVLLSEPKRFVF